MDSSNPYGWKEEELREDLSNSSKEEAKEKSGLSNSMPPKSYMPMLQKQNQGQVGLANSFGDGSLSKPLVKTSKELACSVPDRFSTPINDGPFQDFSKASNPYKQKQAIKSDQDLASASHESESALSGQELKEVEESENNGIDSQLRGDS